MTLQKMQERFDAGLAVDFQDLVGTFVFLHIPIFRNTPFNFSTFHTRLCLRVPARYLSQ
jgi:hypothetical protein